MALFHNNTGVFQNNTGVFQNNMSYIRHLILFVTVAVAQFLSGCGGDTQEQERLRKEAEDIVNETYEVRDY